MPNITYIKKNGKAVGLTVKTQFEMESSEQLFEITGPKTLTWEYTISGKAMNDIGADIVDSHVQNVRSTALKYWRKKFKEDVKKKCVKEIKPLEKLYKAKGDAKASEKKGFETIAANKSESIIEAEFATFMDWASDHNVKKLGGKSAKMKSAGRKVAMGGAVIGVSAVGIAASIASFGTATFPALAAIGITIAALSATATTVKTYQSARKEFRAQQDKLSKSKGVARKALEAALKDAEELHKKYSKLVLHQNQLAVKIEKLDAEAAKLKSAKIDDPKAAKLAKEAQKFNDDLQKDLAKIEAIGDEDPMNMVNGLKAALKTLDEDVKIDERIAAQGRVDKVFGVLGNASNLSNGIAGLAS